MCIYFSFLDLSCSVAATLGVLSAERVAVKAPGTLAVSQPALVLLQSPYNNPQPNTRPHKLAALTADGAHLQPLLGWALINENKYFSSATREAWSGGGVLRCGVVCSGIPARLFSLEYAAKCYFPAIDIFWPQRNMKNEGY